MSCPFSGGQSSGGVCPITGTAATASSAAPHALRDPAEDEKDVPKVNSATWREDLQRLQDSMDGPCPVLKTGGLDFFIDVLNKKEIPLKNMARFLTVEDFIELLKCSPTIDFGGKSTENCKLRKRGSTIAYHLSEYIGDLGIDNGDYLFIEFECDSPGVTFTINIIWDSIEDSVKLENVNLDSTIEGALRLAAKKQVEDINFDDLFFARFAGGKSLLMNEDTLRSIGVTDGDVIEINIMSKPTKPKLEALSPAANSRGLPKKTAVKESGSSSMSPLILAFTSAIVVIAILLNSFFSAPSF